MSVDLVGFVKLVGVGYGLPRLKYVVQAITRGLATTFLRFSRGSESITTVEERMMRRSLSHLRVSKHFTPYKDKKEM